MSIRSRLRRLEEQARADDFCSACMTVQFQFADAPDGRPPTCPRCGRGPGDYGNIVRGFRIGRAATPDVGDAAAG
jgi:hypothetical protein